MTQIFIFGDSITFGESDYQLGGWVNRLRLFFDQSDFNTDEDYILVHNLGVPGDRSDLLLKRMKPEIEARKKEDAKLFIIINIGINDSCLLNGKNKVDIKQFEKNLNKIIKIARKFTEEIVFVGATAVDQSRTTPSSWDVNQFRTNDEIKKYNQVIAQVCQQEKLDLIDVFEQTKEIIKKSEDGLHPDAAGHQIIFEIVKAALVKKIKK